MTVGSGHALNKMQWDHKDGWCAAIGGSNGQLYVYDIGDMAIPHETEWADLQKTIVGGSHHPSRGQGDCAVTACNAVIIIPPGFSITGSCSHQMIIPSGFVLLQ